MSKNKTRVPISEDELMTGDIFELLKKAKIDPKKDEARVREVINYILGEDELKRAFAKACQKNKKSSRFVANLAIHEYLKEKGFL